GKRVWFLHCMYGDLASDLVGAVLDFGVKNLTVVGGAGALDSRFEFGSLLVPEFIRHSDGTNARLNLPAIPGVPRRGVYMRTPTPNLGTVEWVARMKRSGVELIEQELGHVLAEAGKYSDVNLRVAL